MKFMKKLVVLATLTAMLGSSGLQAQDCGYNTGGNGYQEGCSNPCLTPCIVLGTIALVAIIAIAVQNTGHRHHHGHCHN
jgi:carbamoylphosphate synthase small subunit